MYTIVKFNYCYYCCYYY